MSLISTFSAASIRAWRGLQNLWIQIQEINVGTIYTANIACNGTGEYFISSGGNFGNVGYIYYKNGTTWSLQQTISGASPSSPQVAINYAGDVALLGGSIYTRSGSTWTNVQTISSGTNTPISISPSGDYIGIGSLIYYRSGSVWSLQQNLGITTRGGSRITDDYYFISDSSFSGTGATYVYTRSGTTWSLQATLTASDGATSDGFGIGVAINLNADVVMIGAPAKNINTGKVYYFTRLGTSWTEISKFSGPSAATGDLFGDSISFNESGTSVIIGAAGRDAVGYSACGAAYYYNLISGSWQLVQQVNADPLVNIGSFGSSVSLNDIGSYLFVGSAGIMYVFTN